MTTQGGNQLEGMTQLVCFKLGNEQFAVDILTVQEINLMVEITKLPEAPYYCEGVINLRGRVFPVLNLRKKFDMDVVEWNKDTRIIVCVVKDSIVGMVVDSVDEVITLDNSTIEPAPDIVSSANTDYITGVAKLKDNLLIFLDISRIAIEANDVVRSKTDSYVPLTNAVADKSISSKLEKANLDSVEAIISQLKNVTRELDANTSELESAANEVMTCAKATVQAAERMSELTGKQVGCSKQVVATVEETTTAFTEAWSISGNTTRKLAEIIKTIQAETENARQSMEDGLNKGREMADKANSSLNEAVNMSNEAIGVIEMIDSSSGGKTIVEAKVEIVVEPEVEVEVEAKEKTVTKPKAKAKKKTAKKPVIA